MKTSVLITQLIHFDSHRCFDHHRWGGQNVDVSQNLLVIDKESCLTVFAALIVCLPPAAVESLHAGCPRLSPGHHPLRQDREETRPHRRVSRLPQQVGLSNQGE